MLPLFLYCNISIKYNARIINLARYYSLMRYIYWRQRQDKEEERDWTGANGQEKGRETTWHMMSESSTQKERQKIT